MIEPRIWLIRLATVVVARWEGVFREASEQDLELAAIRGEI